MFRINQTDEQAASAAAVSQPDGDDIITDLFWRLSQRVQIAAVVLVEIEQEVRADWAGERPYIAATREQLRPFISLRNACIFSDWRRGERVPLLARRHGVTERRIRQVITELSKVRNEKNKI
jgi:Mor family transcriptional regulator